MKQRRAKKHVPCPQQKLPISFGRQVLLALISIGILLAYFSIPYYNWWLKQRIFQYYREVPHQLEVMNLDGRLTERHAYNYLVPKAIREQTPDSAVILLPTKSYVQKNFSKAYCQWYHSVWNYYFAPRSYVNYKPQAEQDYSKVTHAILCKDGEARFVGIDSPQKLRTVLEIYQNDY